MLSAYACEMFIRGLKMVPLDTTQNMGVFTSVQGRTSSPEMNGARSGTGVEPFGE